MNVLPLVVAAYGPFGRVGAREMVRSFTHGRGVTSSNGTQRFTAWLLHGVLRIVVSYLFSKGKLCCVPLLVYYCTSGSAFHYFQQQIRKLVGTVWGAKEVINIVTSYCQAHKTIP